MFKWGSEYRVMIPLLRAITKKSPLQQQQTDRRERDRGREGGGVSVVEGREGGEEKGRGGEGEGLSEVERCWKGEEVVRRVDKGMKG
jgi:hypothetical protein